MFRFRKLVESISHPRTRILEYIKQGSCMGSKFTLSSPVEEEKLQELAFSLYSEAKEQLLKVIPTAKEIDYSSANNHRNLICIRVYATFDQDFYYVYGISLWIKAGYKWRTYWNGSNTWASSKEFPNDRFTVIYSGCCGDVNVCSDFSVISDYFFAY